MHAKRCLKSGMTPLTRDYDRLDRLGVERFTDGDQRHLVRGAPGLAAGGRDFGFDVVQAGGSAMGFVHMRLHIRE